MPDRIMKSVVLRAPPHHVWPALTDSKSFGTWFGAEFDAFEQLPEAQREEAYQSNAGGWEKQMTLVRSFVERH